MRNQHIFLVIASLNVALSIFLEINSNWKLKDDVLFKMYLQTKEDLNEKDLM